MKVLSSTKFGESRIILTENDVPQEIIIHRDLVLNLGDSVQAKIGAFHPILKGYFAKTDKGDVFIPTDKHLTEGESVSVIITKEARSDKVATAHFTAEKEPDLTIDEEITSETADDMIAEALAPDIALKNGGLLHIEHTRVCWTIDVDSGNNFDSLSKVNEYAINEIARQIRLKNMGGLILVDFAGSKRGKTTQTLTTKLKEVLQKDRRTLVRGWTKSGLLEIERKRTRADLWATCAENNPVNAYYRVRWALDKCRLKNPVLTVSLPIFDLLKRQGVRVKMKTAFDTEVSYFKLEEEK